MDKFYLKIIWLLFSLFSLANSLSLEEREAILHEHSCGANECEVIELEFPSRRKRAADSKISFPLKAFGRERTLSLQLSSGVIVGENTPVYYARSETNIQRTTYQTIKSLVRSQFYEDKVNLAAFTIDTESEIPKIKYGIVHSENLTITPLNPSKNSSNSSPRQYYLAKFSLSNLVNDMMGWVGGVFGGWGSFHKRTTPVPAQVYPEILAVIDHNLIKLYGNSIFQHTIDLWNQIDAVYRPLQNPSIKLSIAGFLIPERTSDSNENRINFVICSVKETNRDVLVGIVPESNQLENKIIGFDNYVKIDYIGDLGNAIDEKYKNWLAENPNQLIYQFYHNAGYVDHS